MGCVQSSSGASDGQKSLLMLGLDGSGSTTILYQIVTGKKLETIPTLSFNHEEIKYNGVEYQIYDIGGLDKLRPLWKQYSREANGYVFVLDAADAARAQVAAQELTKFYREDAKKSTSPSNPLLVYANKQDLPDAMDAAEVEKILALASLPTSTYKVFPCCGRTGENLRPGLDWMTEQLKRHHPSYYSGRLNRINDVDTSGKEFFWNCCGAEDVLAAGCELGRHLTYDE